jgi:hypothetical protein
MNAPLDRLILEAKSLARLGCKSAAARHCAAVEAARTPRIDRSVHGAAKARIAFALKLLMQSAQDLREPVARGFLLLGVGDVAEALKHEPDRVPPVVAPYWMKDELRETA